MTIEQAKNKVAGYNALILFFHLFTFLSAFLAMAHSIYALLIISILFAIIIAGLERKKKELIGRILHHLLDARNEAAGFTPPTAQHSQQPHANDHD